VNPSIQSWIAHPRTKGLDLDDPRTTELRRQIILEKPFLQRIYREWYDRIQAALPSGPGAVLELGSGGGFLKSCLPEMVTSDILRLSGIDVVLDGMSLPFRDRSLRAIVMTNVFHHLAQPRRFLTEALRCVREGGRLICIEPWLSPWALFVMRHLHHEQFDPGATTWEFEAHGPLSDGNGALPWIVFERDRARFGQEFPEWEVDIRRIGMPVRYLLSGGVSSRLSAPACTFGLFRFLENVVTRRTSRLDMFVTIVLTRGAARGRCT